MHACSFIACSTHVVRILHLIIIIPISMRAALVRLNHVPVIFVANVLVAQ